MSSFLRICKSYQKYLQDYSDTTRHFSDVLKPTKLKNWYEQSDDSDSLSHTKLQARNPSFENIKTLRFLYLAKQGVASPSPLRSGLTPFESIALWRMFLHRTTARAYEPVAFLSKVMYPAESRYPTFEQKAFGSAHSFCGVETWSPPCRVQGWKQ